MPPLFDHDKLNVYQESIAFIRWTVPLLDKLPASASVRGQLDRASTSIPLNLAEGNGKFTSPDRCRFFDTARGSALECAAGLDVAVAKGFLSEAEAAAGKAKLVGIVSMIVGLIRSNSVDRLHEEPVAYRAGTAD